MEGIMKLTKIFEPITINKTEFKNRMVVSAMVTNYCNEDGTPTEKFMAYHEHKAKGGYGIIITEDFAVTRTAGASKTLAGLWEDRQVEPWRVFTDRIHKAGAKTIAQIYHAGRETSSQITGEQPIAPSAIKDPTMPEAPREMRIDEIHDLEKSFVDAALRAKTAGFDGVEVHGAHGYLINQFVSPFSNKRCDEYGGTTENRTRFPREIIQAIRLAAGEDFPIFYRMSSEEYVPGGLEIEESKLIARLIEDAGADCIHCSQGVFATGHIIIPPAPVPVGGFVHHAAALKTVVDIPVIAVGRINDPLLAESILASGSADLCTMGRASLADPEMPEKARRGDFASILHCIGCVQGCAGEHEQGHPIRCLVNPLTGMEDVYDVSPAAEPKKVVVVGGGVSGCEAAIAAAGRGHHVTLLEKSEELGGQWIAASIPMAKGDFSSFIVWQKYMLEKLGVEVRFHVDATKDTLEELKPDAVILATGSNPAMPPIKGLREYGVVAQKVLRGEAEVGNKVVVIGGGLVGAETADYLAEHGCGDVTIVEMLPQIVKDGEPAPTYYLKKRMAEHGVKVLTSAAVQEVKEHGVVYKKDDSCIEIADVDTVVIAIGVRANTALEESLTDCSFTIVSVGDCHERAKNGYRGIQEGYEAGIRI